MTVGSFVLFLDFALDLDSSVVLRSWNDILEVLNVGCSCSVAWGNMKCPHHSVCMVRFQYQWTTYWENAPYKSATKAPSLWAAPTHANPLPPLPKKRVVCRISEPWKSWGGGLGVPHRWALVSEHENFSSQLGEVRVLYRVIEFSLTMCLHWGFFTPPDSKKWLVFRMLININKTSPCNAYNR